jgi:hypothetical protein
MPISQKYKKWPCPKCGTATVVPAIIGMPDADLMELERDGHVILWGCSIFGNEPENPVQCTHCSWTGEIRKGKLFPTLTEINPSVIDDCRVRIRQVFETCHELSMLTRRPISPDGHLVGSLGEIFAAVELGLSLATPSNKGYDAVDARGNKVEIKTTTGRSISLSAAGTEATRLVVVVLDRTGEASIAFDGPAQAVWNLAGPAQKSMQSSSNMMELNFKKIVKTNSV